MDKDRDTESVVSLRDGFTIRLLGVSRPDRRNSAILSNLAQKNLGPSIHFLVSSVTSASQPAVSLPHIASLRHHQLDLYPRIDDVHKRRLQTRPSHKEPINVLLLG
jgi:hypothetical protein